MRTQAFKRLARDESGSMLPMAAFGFVILGGVAALAVDAGNLYALDNQMQASADAAALAAVAHIRDTPAEVREAALDVTAANLPSEIHGAALAESDIVLGEWDSDTKVFTAGINPPNAVRVTIRRTAENGNAAPSIFANVLGVSSADIVVESIAAEPNPSCMVALAPSGTGVYINSGSAVVANGCSVRANSTSSNAIVTNSGSTMAASEICVEGGYSGSGYSPSPETGCGQSGDPLAGLAAPSAAGGPCDYNDRVVESGVETLFPGVYCGKLEVNGGLAEFAPGIYVLDDAEFIVNSGGSAVGTGVSFYLTGGSAKLKFNSDSHVEFSAPVSGEMAGIIVYEDRGNPLENEHLINSDATSTFEGTVYLPRGRLVINSNATSNGSSPFTAFVAYRFEVNSASGIQINTNFEDSVVPLPKNLSGGRSLRL